jgi:hypothetical protein
MNQALELDDDPVAHLKKGYPKNKIIQAVAFAIMLHIVGIGVYAYFGAHKTQNVKASDAAEKKAVEDAANAAAAAEPAKGANGQPAAKTEPGEAAKTPSGEKKDEPRIDPNEKPSGPPPRPGDGIDDLFK